MTGVSSLMELVGRLMSPTASLVGFREPIQRGSAHGYVTVEDDAEGGGSHLLMVRLEVLAIPDGLSPALSKKLLELNHEMRGRASFSLAAGMIYLTAGRPMEDLDPGEVLDLVIWTAEKADHLDDLLAAEFGTGGAP